MNGTRLSEYPSSRFVFILLASLGLVSVVSRARSIEDLTAHEIDATNRVEDLVRDTWITRNLAEMDKAKLRKGQLKHLPWSTGYWPMDHGIIASRYLDSNFGSTNDWAKNFDYVTLNPANQIVSLGSPSALEKLSPAEKYDLLVGDTQWSLTKAMWDRGASYFKSSGKVAHWMGICDGWSMASIMTPEPTKAIELSSPTGLKLRFYPSDVKALTALLWNTGKMQISIIGTKCRVKHPARDASGRILDESCFNSNPATWHMAVVNTIGLAQQSFVFDSTYDFEIWNQPMAGYAYSYFNPQTLKRTENLDEALVESARFDNDKFKQWRGPKTKFIVGVAMEVSYGVEIKPAREVGPQSSIRTVNYVYDLELDADKNVIGGEWHLDQHPGFMWRAAPGSRSVSVGDEDIPAEALTWDGVSPVPVSWGAPAVKSSHQGQPLAAIVEELLLRSQSDSVTP